MSEQVNAAIYPLQYDTNGFFFNFLIFLPMYMCLYYIQCTGRPGGLEDSPETVINTKEIQMVVSCHVGVWDLNMGLLEK